MARRCFKYMDIGWVCENHPNLPWSEEIGLYLWRRQCNAHATERMTLALKPEYKEVL